MAKCKYCGSYSTSLVHTADGPVLYESRGKLREHHCPEGPSKYIFYDTARYVLRGRETRDPRKTEPDSLVGRVKRNYKRREVLETTL